VRPLPHLSGDLTMTDPTQPDLLAKAKVEISGMARDGMAHPSTKPVLTGAAIGGVAAALLPMVSVPIGLLAGAGYALYRRLQ
jgi:hypothetical protein